VKVEKLVDFAHDWKKNRGKYGGVGNSGDGQRVFEGQCLERYVLEVLSELFLEDGTRY